MKSFSNGLYQRGKSWVARFNKAGVETWKVLGKISELTESEARRFLKDLKNTKTKFAQVAPLPDSTELLDLHIIRQAASPRVFNAVYFLFSDEELVYIGQSKNLLDRLGRHAGTKPFTHFAAIRCNEKDLDALEAAYINKFQPRLNGEWKDGTKACSRKKLL